MKHNKTLTIKYIVTCFTENVLPALIDMEYWWSGELQVGSYLELLATSIESADLNRFIHILKTVKEVGSEYEPLLLYSLQKLGLKEIFYIIYLYFQHYQHIGEEILQQKQMSILIEEAHKFQESGKYDQILQGKDEEMKEKFKKFIEAEDREIENDLKIPPPRYEMTEDQVQEGYPFGQNSENFSDTLTCQCNECTYQEGCDAMYEQ
jgi:hypothetical protein